MKCHSAIFIYIFLQVFFSLSSSSPSSDSKEPHFSVPRIQRQGQHKTVVGGGHRVQKRSVISGSKRSHPVPFYNHLEFSEDDDDVPSVRVHLVKNVDLKKWRRSQGPDAYLTRHPLSPSILMLHHRNPRAGLSQPPSSRIGRPVARQSPGGGGGGGDPDITEKPAVVTPVLPINGDKKYNETDCLPWEEVAILLRSSMHPKFKRQYIDPQSCNLKTGLECLPFEEKGAIVHRCRCMIVYGPKAVYTNYTDNTGRTKLKCFIPAGLGWDSECHVKSWSNYGYPLPFGDPSGTNAEQAAQTDAFNTGDGEQVIVEYIRWNSIVPECVPGAECREKGTYTGQRCQCKPGHLLEKPKGTCNGALGKMKMDSWMVGWGMVGVGVLVLEMFFGKY